MKHAEKWYQTRLAFMFEEDYGHLENEIEWYVDPAPNMWMFDVPSHKLRVTLTCDDMGVVTRRFMDIE